MARVQVGIDDASRLAVTGICPDEKAVSAITCLRAAVAYYYGLGIIVNRVMTDRARVAPPVQARWRGGRAANLSPSRQPARP